MNGSERATNLKGRNDKYAFSLVRDLSSSSVSLTAGLD